MRRYILHYGVSLHPANDTLRGLVNGEQPPEKGGWPRGNEIIKAIVKCRECDREWPFATTRAYARLLGMGPVIQDLNGYGLDLCRPATAPDASPRPVAWLTLACYREIASEYELRICHAPRAGRHIRREGVPCNESE